MDCDILQEKLAPAGVGIPTERAQGAINALTFTFRAAVQASVEAEELTTELKSFGASDSLLLPTTSLFVNSRTLMGCADPPSKSKGGRRTPSVSSRFGSKLPHLC